LHARRLGGYKAYQGQLIADSSKSITAGKLEGWEAGKPLQLIADSSELEVKNRSVAIRIKIHHENTTVKSASLKFCELFNVAGTG